MLHAQFLEGFLNWPHTSSLKIGVFLPDAFDGFRVILSFPFERLGQYIIKRRGGVLSMPVRVLV